MSKTGTVQGNPSIRCSVETCAYHGNGICTRSSIQVGQTAPDVTRCEATQCASFHLGGPSGLR